MVEVKDIEVNDIRGLIARDSECRATSAIVRWLRDAAQPLSGMLRESLSFDDHKLSGELLQSVAKAERSIIAAWEEAHPGRRWRQSP